MSKDNNKKVFLTYSNKGGIGKSTFAGAIVDYMRRNLPQKSYACFDTDVENKSLMINFGGKNQDPYVGIGGFDVKDPNYTDWLTTTLANYPSDRYLFDLPGGVGTSIMQRYQDGRHLIQDYNDAGYEVTVIIIVSFTVDTVNALYNAYQLFGDTVNYVVLLNKQNNNSIPLTIYENVLFKKYSIDGGKTDNTAEQFAINVMKAKIIPYPTLTPNTYALWSYMNKSFSEAVVEPINQFWGPSQQGDIRRIINSYDAIVAQII